MHTPHAIPTALPRPLPVPPKAAGPAKPAVKPAEEANNLRLLTYLRLHWLKIVFCGLLLGGGGAYAAWELLATKFESTALLRVESIPEALGVTNAANAARTDLATYIKTQSNLIKSDFVLNAALRDLKDCPTIKAQKDPIKYLEEELIVTSADGSEVIKVTFKGHEPADTKKIVDAVQKAFMTEVIQKEVVDKEIFVKKVEDYMTKMRIALDKNVENLDKSYLKSGAPVAAVTPVGPPVPGAPLPPIAPGGAAPAAAGAAPGGAAPPAGPANNQLTIQPLNPELAKMNPAMVMQKAAGFQARVEQLPLALSADKRRMAALQQKIEDIRKAPPSQETLDAVEKDLDVIKHTYLRDMAKHHYDFRKGTTRDETAPGLRELRDAYEAQEAKLTQVRKDKIDTLERSKRIAEGKQIMLEMEEVINRIHDHEEELAAMKALLNHSEAQLAQLPITAIGDPSKHFSPEFSKVDSTDSLYRRLVQQYYLTKMQLDSPTRVKVLQTASNPAQKDMKKQIIGTVFAGLLGFGLMALGVIAFETATKRVSSLVDVKSSSPIPVVGVIPCLPGEAIGKDPLKRAAASEAIDKLRAYVAQTWLARGATTVAVTSPLADEGKAFTAFALASSLAQSGYKTLIVDFDLRDPQLHAFAGLPNQTGVCELLRAETDPRAAIQYLPSGLHLLTAGKWSDEARKAATGERLEALLAKLKGPYDCVVLHSHALLTAAESVEAARRCEVVLICALYRHTTTPLLKRAAERIAAMEVPYSGVVYVGATGQEALC